MKRGEYKLARPDKKRPVLILTRDSILDYLGEVTIAPITSTVRNPFGSCLVVERRDEAGARGQL